MIVCPIRSWMPRGHGVLSLGVCLCLLMTSAIVVADSGRSRSIDPAIAFEAVIEAAAQIQILDDGVLLAGEGGVTRQNFDGTLRWRTPAELRFVQDAQVSPDGRHVLARTFREFWALDADTGAVSWQIRFVTPAFAPISPYGTEESPHLPGAAVVHTVPGEDFGAALIVDAQIHRLAPEVVWIATGSQLVAVALVSGAVVDTYLPGFPIERFELRHQDAGPVLLIGNADQQVLHNPTLGDTRFLVQPGQLPSAIETFRISPAGHHMLLGGRDWVLVLDLASGEHYVLPGVTGYTLGLAVMPREVPRLYLQGLFNVIDVVALDGGQIVGGLAGHAASPRKLLVSDDGGQLLSAAADGLPRLWDTQRNLELARLAAHSAPVVDLAWTPTRQRAVSLDGNGTVRLFDLSTAGEPVADLASDLPVLTIQRGHAGVGVALAVSPDGTVIASAYGEEIIVWDRVTGLALRRMPLPRDAEVFQLLFRSETELLSVDRLGFLRRWDVRNGAELERRRVVRYARLAAANRAGTRLAIASHDSSDIMIFDLDTSLLQATVRVEAGGQIHGYITTMALSADGRRLAVGGSDGRLFEYDAVQGERIGEQRAGETRRISQLVYSDDGALLAAATTHTVNWYATADSTLVDEFPVGGSVMLAFEAGDGAILAVGKGGFDSVVRRISLDPVNRRFESEESFGMLRTAAGASLPDRDVVFTGTDGALIFQSLKDGADAKRILNPVAPLSDLAFSDDGRELTIATAAGFDVWSFDDGRVGQTRSERVVYPYNTHSRITPDRDALLIVDTRTLRVLPRDPNQATLTLAHGVSSDAPGSTRAVGRPGSTQVLLVSGQQAVLLEPASGNQVATFVVPPDPERSEFENILGDAAFSANGEQLLLTTWAGRAHLFDVESGRTLQHLTTNETCLSWDADGAMQRRRLEQGFCAAAALPTFSPEDEQLALVLRTPGTDKLLLLDRASHKLHREIESGEPRIRTVAFSPDGALIATAGDSGMIRLWDRETGTLQAILGGRSGRVARIAFSPDGRHLASAGRDGATLIFDVTTGMEIVEMLSFGSGGWAVTARDGRYDASDPGSAAGLFWVLPDEPLRPLPIELFFKDYYEPRLLPRLLAGERFAAATPLASLNRDQPEVRIETVISDPEHPDRLQVALALRYATRVPAAAVDAVKLFRDGQLVGQLDREALAGAGRAGSEWTSLTLRGIQQPSGIAPLTFSTYAFNEDGIKSRTASHVYERQAALTRPSRRAFVISIGVNQYENPAWNLFYAGNDARVTNTLLGDALAAADFDEVIPVLLIADHREDTITATRAHLEAVLEVLGGHSGDGDLLAELPGAHRLTKATPDDMLIISFSGHGLSEQGRFHFFLYDIGAGASRRVDEATLARTLDSDRFAGLMLDIDAGRQAMIIDACNAAASVNADGFRPGPMGSRGLGQMAYDKRMLILAASQAEDVAIESAQLRHGIMSYALLREGLGAGLADFDPPDGRIDLGEWTRWGLARVPELYEEIFEGRFEGGSRGVASIGLQARGGGDDDDWDDWDDIEPPQQPSLFDFRDPSRPEVRLSPPRQESAGGPESPGAQRD